MVTMISVIKLCQEQIRTLSLIITRYYNLERKKERERERERKKEKENENLQQSSFENMFRSFPSAVRANVTMSRYKPDVLVNCA